MKKIILSAICLLMLCALCISVSAEDDDILYRKGDSGSVIEGIQARLAELEYYEGSENGIFDDELERSVKSFQTWAGVPATGEIDVETAYLMFLEDALHKPFDFSEIPDGVLILQQRLCELGYLSPDQVNGYYSNETYDAVFRFRINEGWGPAGCIDSRALWKYIISDAPRKVSMTGSVFSEENPVIIVGIACFALGLGSGFFFGRRNKKAADGSEYGE